MCASSRYRRPRSRGPRVEQRRRVILRWPVPASRIFISYRRGDSSGHAGRLSDRLIAEFGEAHVFMDVDTIEPGADFVEYIDEAVGSCDVLIALIGDEWLDCRDAQGTRRLDDPEDFVRLEVAAGIQRDIRVIPVLVEGATMPRTEELPEPLRRLARRHALEVSDSRWRQDVNRLVETIHKVLGGKETGKAIREVSSGGPESSAAGTRGAMADPTAASGGGPEASPFARRKGTIPRAIGARGVAVSLVAAAVAGAILTIASLALVGGDADSNSRDSSSNRDRASDNEQSRRPDVARPSSTVPTAPAPTPERSVGATTTFSTPRDSSQRYRAAYCRIQSPNAEATLYCWTPNDGYTLALTSTGAAYRVRADETTNEDLTPDDYRVVGFGEETESSVFSCESDSSALTCRNPRGHGFRLPRYRGLPTFWSP